jgi:hypothetical protein
VRLRLVTHASGHPSEHPARARLKAEYGALTVTAEQVVPLRVDSEGRVLMERSA